MRTRDAATLLEARRLSAGYGGRPMVRDLDLSVRPGELAVLLGANGAGKTTTLLALSGELPPLAGEVRWAGRATRARLHHRARDGLALVTEGKAVFMRLSVAENLRLGRGSVAAAVDLFPELREHLGRKAGLLSGGQQQMLALARVLAARPRALLVDEMSLGLAPPIVRRLYRAVRQAADEHGLGVLLVEQHARQALAVADRGYLLHRGRLVLAGGSAELTGRIEEIERGYLDGG